MRMDVRHSKPAQHNTLLKSNTNSVSQQKPAVDKSGLNVRQGSSKRQDTVRDQRKAML